MNCVKALCVFKQEVQIEVKVKYRVSNDHEHAQANKFKSVVEFKNMVA